jgi:hypothetical protein
MMTRDNKKVTLENEYSHDRIKDECILKSSICIGAVVKEYHLLDPSRVV